ncbi:MAG: dolichyl-phosphate beta-D-mannosyltransferase [Candidatus Marinimicrobia bacterium]|mgnify:CR=1 FL=1|nr:dolichyl-phosphate beta-D-mannosyltransferase [Candidatus Neomarinimicrobiota bacterium]
MKTIVVTPTYNEQKNINELLGAIFSVNSNFHVLVVDDNSPDGTGSIVKKLQSTYPNLHLLSRNKKDGLGSAYIAGFKYALKRDFDAIVQMDADMSHDPKDIVSLISELENTDIAIGSRYISGVNVVNWPMRRLMISYGANIYTRLVTGLPVKDATGGFKCWKRKVLEALDLNNIQSQGYSFQIEMTYRAWLKGFKIKEVPIVFVDRTIGESKMTHSVMLEAVIMIPRLRLGKTFGWYR